MESTWYGFVNTLKTHFPVGRTPSHHLAVLKPSLMAECPKILLSVSRGHSESYDCDSEGYEIAVGRTSSALGGRTCPRIETCKSHLNQFFCPYTRREVELLRTTIQCSSQQVGSCLEIYQNHSTKRLQHSNSSLRCCPSPSLCVLAWIRLKLMHSPGGGNGPVKWVKIIFLRGLRQSRIRPGWPS